MLDDGLRTAVRAVDLPREHLGTARVSALECAHLHHTLLRGLPDLDAYKGRRRQRDPFILGPCDPYFGPRDWAAVETVNLLKPALIHNGALLAAGRLALVDRVRQQETQRRFKPGTAAPRRGHPLLVERPREAWHGVRPGGVALEQPADDDRLFFHDEVVAELIRRVRPAGDVGVRDDEVAKRRAAAPGRWAVRGGRR